MRNVIRFIAIALGASLAFASTAAFAADKKTERLWKSKCASCHGEDGKADTEKGKQMKIVDLGSDGTQGKSDADLKKAITEGTNREADGVKKEMDPYKDELKEKEIDSLVQFIRGLKK